MEQDLKELEAKLNEASPELMPEDMITRMASAMDKWYEGTRSEEKIIPFERIEKAQQQVAKSKLKMFNTWAQVAAVALVATVSYLTFNHSNSSTEDLAIRKTSVVTPLAQQVPMKNIESTVPASNSQVPRNGFSTQLKNASQNMIIFDANGRPVRLMQVEFEDKVIVRDHAGNPHVLKKPHVEYYAVPAEIH